LAISRRISSVRLDQSTRSLRISWSVIRERLQATARCTTLFRVPRNQRWRAVRASIIAKLERRCATFMAASRCNKVFAAGFHPGSQFRRLRSSAARDRGSGACSSRKQTLLIRRDELLTVPKPNLSGPWNRSNDRSHWIDFVEAAPRRGWGYRVYQQNPVGSCDFQ